MNYEQLKADMEAGTQGDWCAPSKYPSEIENTQGLTVASCWHEHAVDKEITLVGILPCTLDESRANASRIARVPQLERIALAAEALEASLKMAVLWLEFDGKYNVQGMNASLAEYREATK